MTPSQVIHFDIQHNYFSDDPLVGKTSDEKNLSPCNNLMQAVYLELSGQHREFLTYEILTKVIAYRNLEKGDLLYIPQETHLGVYYVDKVFDLWNGMPAYGLISKTAPPILLFRGTVGKATKAGMSSLTADLDPFGPGYTLYLDRIRPEVEAFIQAQRSPIIVCGFSLGASLASYVTIHQSANVLKAYLFNHPGVQARLVRRWDKIKNKPPVITFLTKGDFVSSCGGFIGDVYELSLTKPLNPALAHSHLMLAKPHCTLRKGLRNGPLARSYTFGSPLSPCNLP